MLKLLDFYADWCAPCKIMAPVLEEIEREFQGKIELVQIDVDQETDLASKYSVLSIPTYILEKDGAEVDRLVGARPKNNLSQIIHKHLNE